MLRWWSGGGSVLRPGYTWPSGWDISLPSLESAVLYSIDLEAQYLICKSKQDALAATAIIAPDSWMSPARMMAAARCFNHSETDLAWRIDVEEFNGFDWDDEHAHPVWARVAPHMADGATIEFRGADNEHWQIRWESGLALVDFTQQVIWASSRRLSGGGR